MILFWIVCINKSIATQLCFSRRKQKIVRRGSGKLLESHLTNLTGTPAAGAGPRAAPLPCATPWMMTRTTWCSWSPGQPGASPRWASSHPWAGGRAPLPRPCPGPSPTPSTRSAAETGAGAPLPRRKGFFLVTCQSRSQARSKAPEPAAHCRVHRATAAWARWSRLPDTRSGGEWGVWRDVTSVSWPVTVCHQRVPCPPDWPGGIQSGLCPQGALWWWTLLKLKVRLSCLVSNECFALLTIDCSESAVWA